VPILLLLAAAAPHHPARRHHAAAPPPPNSQHRQAAAKLAATEQARAAAVAAGERAARQLQAASARAATLADQRVTEAARLRVLETQTDEAARQFREASSAETTAEQQVAARTRDLQTLLPLALRLSLYPAETMLAAPAAPDQALEGLLLTHGISAEIAREVKELRAEEATAATLRQTVAQRQQELTNQRGQQLAAAAVLDHQQQAAQQAEAAAQGDIAAAAQAASKLAAQASDLRGAIAAMEAAEQQAAARAAQEAAAATRKKQTAAAQSARAKETALRSPAGPGLTGAIKTSLVAGRVARAFGAPAEDGPATGVTFSTAPAAYVSSPCTGRVGFAGPFRSYGRLLIIECGGGYDFVLAGLDRLDAAVGNKVRAGEPVGRMADFDPAKSADRPGLYVELRRSGQAVDPMPFLKKG